MTLLAFFLAFATLLIGILNALPTAQLPPEISAGVGTIFQYVYAWNFLLPIDTMFLALKVIIQVYIALFIWWATNKVIGWVRGGTS